MEFEKMIAELTVLNDELQRKALEELHEDPEKRNEDIRSIRRWLDERNYTKRNDPKFILMFLRTCKFDHEKTKKKIAAYYTFCRDYPTWFTYKDPSSAKMDALLNLGVYIPCDYDSVSGCRVYVCRIGISDPYTTSLEDVLTVERMIVDAVNSDDQSEILGFEVLTDMKGFGFGHLRHYTPNVIRIYTKHMNAFPSRLKAVHFINMPLLFKSLFSLAKLMMSSKMKSRFHVHSDVSNLRQFIPSDSLPDEYGGTSGSLLTYIERAKQEVLKKTDFLKGIMEHT